MKYGGMIPFLLSVTIGTWTPIRSFSSYLKWQRLLERNWTSGCLWDTFSSLKNRNGSAPTFLKEPWKDVSWLDYCQGASVWLLQHNTCIRCLKTIWAKVGLDTFNFVLECHLLLHLSYFFYSGALISLVAVRVNPAQRHRKVNCSFSYSKDEATFLFYGELVCLLLKKIRQMNAFP